MSSLVTTRAAARMRPRGDVVQWGQLVAQLLVAKLTVVLVVFLAYKLLPFASDIQAQHFVDPAHDYSPLEVAFSTWDGQHFLFLSEAGYAPNQQSDIQFPLFPALIHLVTPLLGSSVVAGLIVSNVASLIAFVLLFDLVANLYDERTARRTLLLTLAFPTAFFFALVYSESVFLLLVVLFFRFALRGQLGWAAIPAALLPLSRAPGVLIVVPFVACYAADVRRASPRALLTLSPLLGLAAYFAFMRATTGDALQMVHGAAQNGSGFSMTAWLQPLTLWQQLFGQPLAIHGFTDSLLDRAFFLAFLALLLPLFRRVHVSLALYALAMGLVSVASGSFVSYMRYAAVLFPMFVVVAQLLEGKRAFLWTPLLYLCAMLQGLFLTMQALNYWVA
ncbi:MAG: glycosyltransferase family 39 protein [Chloroflexi bacterium]|nr:glycosyltransferase family 39 protein [Chloroflexota bacterium]